MRLAPLLVVALVAIPAIAVHAKDRSVTDQERPRLEAALKQAGCTGGKMEFDDDKRPDHPNGKFEVDETTCEDGKKYELTFDPDFKLLTRKLD